MRSKPPARLAKLVMRKVVLDTNVLISGVIASGYSASILDAARREEIKLVTSTQLLEEFSDVISRRHIARKYPKAAQEAESLLDFLRGFSILPQAFQKQILLVVILTMISYWLAPWTNQRIASFQATRIFWI